MGIKKKTASGGSFSKLMLVNFVFFLIVAGGIMAASGHSLFDLLGSTLFAAKKKDEAL